MTTSSQDAPSAAQMLATFQFDRTLTDALGMGSEQWPTVSIKTLRWWCEAQLRRADLPLEPLRNVANKRGQRIRKYSLIGIDAGDVVLTVAEATCAASDAAIARLVGELQ